MIEAAVSYVHIVETPPLDYTLSLRLGSRELSPFYCCDSQLPLDSLSILDAEAYRKLYSSIQGGRKDERSHNFSPPLQPLLRNILPIMPAGEGDLLNCLIGVANGCGEVGAGGGDA